MHLGSELGIQSCSFHDVDTLEGLVERMRALEVRRIELSSRHLAPTLSQIELKEALVTLACGRVFPSAWGVFPMGLNPRDDRALLLRAQLIGIPLLAADPEPDSLHAVGYLAAEHGVRVAIHNQGPGHRWGKVEALGDALAEANAWVGACLDTGHLLRAGEDPLAAVATLGPRLFGVHLKDVARRADGEWGGCALGKGALALRPFLERLAAINWSGVLSLECEKGGGDSMRELRESLAAFAEAMRA